MSRRQGFQVQKDQFGVVDRAGCKELLIYFEYNMKNIYSTKYKGFSVKATRIKRV